MRKSVGAVNAAQLWWRMLKKLLVGSFYAPLLASAMALMLARLMVFAKILEPVEFSHLNAMLLASSGFVMFACFGLYIDLQRKLPIILIRRDGWQSITIILQSIIATFVLFCLALFFVFLLSVSAVNIDNTNWYLLGIVHGVAQQIFLISTTDTRSRGRMNLYSAQNFGRAILVISFGTLVAISTNNAIMIIIIDSIITASIGLYVTFRVWAIRRYPVIFLCNIVYRSMRRLHTKSMLVLMMSSISAYASINLDRWIALNYLSIVEFSQFSFIVIIITFALSLQAIINASAFPYLARQYWTRGKKHAFRTTMLISFSLLALGLLSIWPMYLIIEATINKYYRSYLPSIEVAPLILAAACFRVSDFASSYLLIAKLERRYFIGIMSSVSVVSAIYISNNTFFELGDGIELISAISFISALLSYLLSVGLAWHATCRG